MSMTYGSCALQMPRNYIAMNADEMTYIEGGYWLDMATSTAASAIDITIAIVSLGMAISTSIANVISKMGVSWLKSKGITAITKIGLSIVVAERAVNLITTVTNFTVGNGIAWILDGIDNSGRNGRIQF